MLHNGPMKDYDEFFLPWEAIFIKFEGCSEMKSPQQYTNNIRGWV
jgi:hypothetical protein